MTFITPSADRALRSPWLAGFGVVTAAHLVLNASGVSGWDSLTKCLLAPLLAAWTLSCGGPRILALALGFCFLGDLFLEFDSLFVVGMAAFAAAHLCFITLFVRRGALDRLRTKPWIAVVLTITAVGLIGWVWGGLEPGLRGPVVVYALLLTGTAALALAVDLRAGIGGLFFLFSDGLIAVRIAERLPPDSRWGSVVVMATYALAIFLLTTAIVLRELRTRHGQRTDCWPRLPEKHS